MNRHLTLYYPLWGATFDADGCGAIGRSVIACVPHEDEWRLIQKTDVHIEHLRHGQGLGANVPLCLTAFTPLSAGQMLDDGIAEFGAAMRSRLRDGVTALRLHKPGWFLDPEFAETAFVIAEPQGQWVIQRAPGPYRQAFVAGPPPQGLPGFQLSISELRTSVEIPGMLDPIFDLLQSLRAARPAAAIDIALEQFNRSYAFVASPSQRLVDLFTALDAMLGGMSVRRLGKVQLRGRGFRRRLETALKAAGHPSAVDDAAWLDRMEGGRGLRDALAHGSRVEIPPSTIERLQAIVRVLLHQFAGFAIRWAREHSELLTRLELPESCSLTAAYNMALQEAGDDKLQSLLDWRQAPSTVP